MGLRRWVRCRRDRPMQVRLSPPPRPKLGWGCFFAYEVFDFYWNIYPNFGITSCSFLSSYQGSVVGLYQPKWSAGESLPRRWVPSSASLDITWSCTWKCTRKFGILLFLWRFCTLPFGSILYAHVWYLNVRKYLALRTTVVRVCEGLAASETIGSVCESLGSETTIIGADRAEVWNVLVLNY
jgi:hypothetical protein